MLPNHRIIFSFRTNASRDLLMLITKIIFTLINKNKMNSSLVLASCLMMNPPRSYYHYHVRLETFEIVDTKWKGSCWFTTSGRPTDGRVTNFELESPLWGQLYGTVWLHLTKYGVLSDKECLSVRSQFGVSTDATFKKRYPLDFNTNSGFVGLDQFRWIGYKSQRKNYVHAMLVNKDM